MIIIITAPFGQISSYELSSSGRMFQSSFSKNRIKTACFIGQKVSKFRVFLVRVFAYLD